MMSTLFLLVVQCSCLEPLLGHLCRGQFFRQHVCDHPLPDFPLSFLTEMLSTLFLLLSTILSFYSLLSFTSSVTVISLLNLASRVSNTTSINSITADSYIIMSVIILLILTQMNFSTSSLLTVYFIVFTSSCNHFFRNCFGFSPTSLSFGG